jgi:hypothetical protein
VRKQPFWLSFQPFCADLLASPTMPFFFLSPSYQQLQGLLAATAFSTPYPILQHSFNVNTKLCRFLLCVFLPSLLPNLACIAKPIVSPIFVRGVKPPQYSTAHSAYTASPIDTNRVRGYTSLSVSPARRIASPWLLRVVHSISPGYVTASPARWTASPPIL